MNAHAPFIMADPLADLEEAFETITALEADLIEERRLRLEAEAMLAKLLAKPAAPARKAASRRPAHPWEAEYNASRKATLSTWIITYADGEVIRSTVATNPGKHPNLAPALRASIARYRDRAFGRMGRPRMCEGSSPRPFDCLIPVPAIVDMVEEDTEAVADAGAASEWTAELRAGEWNRPCTPDVTTKYQALWRRRVMPWLAAWRGRERVKSARSWDFRQSLDRSAHVADFADDLDGAAFSHTRKPDWNGRWEAAQAYRADFNARREAYANAL